MHSFHFEQSLLSQFSFQILMNCSNAITLWENISIFKVFLFNEITIDENTPIYFVLLIFFFVKSNLVWQYFFNAVRNEHTTQLLHCLKKRISTSKFSIEYVKLCKWIVIFIIPLLSLTPHKSMYTSRVGF